MSSQGSTATFELEIQDMNQKGPAKPVKTKRVKEVKWDTRRMEHYEPPAADPEEIDFRHSHWKWKRKLVLEALLKSGTGQTGISAFEHCGSDCYVKYCKEENCYSAIGNFCHNRHCEPCMRQKANLMAANLRKKLEENPKQIFRFITLTLKHSDTPLREQIDRIYDSFKKLRKTKVWAESQRGGATILEIKWNPDNGEWHPHLHIIAEGDFVRQAALSDAWLNITKDSYRVDIRIIGGAKDACHYVSKYVGKGVNQECWINEGAAIEFVCAMKGTRTCATFGSWRGYALLEHPKDDRLWTPIGRLTDIVRLANEGNPYYVRLLDQITADLQYNPHKPRGKKTQPMLPVPD